MLPPPGPDTRGIEQEFYDLLLDDADLLRAEFDELIAAAWSGTPPARPSRNTRPDPDRRPTRRAASRPTGRPVRPGSDARPRQRSPPP
ncbi:hypothetical protein [Microlunatus ginsengisoli]|uniref:Uncharacterized protein n=1 Tax=Microlunatus ginsengisoli TaxID=363863 RepID=A0ABP7AK48_9ACTN